MKKHATVGEARPRKVGRPLSFDRDTALERAMLTFWRHGYETTSIADLTTAMEITPPSLYTAFGDKKRLFLEAANRYAGDPAVLAARIDAAPSAYDAVRTTLLDAAIAFTGAATPRGCLLESATASGSSESADVQAAIGAIRRRIGAMLRARIQRDVAAGSMPPATSAAALADLAIVIVQGLSVLARDGASRARLIGACEAALGAWPGRPGPPRASKRNR